MSELTLLKAEMQLIRQHNGQLRKLLLAAATAQKEVVSKMMTHEAFLGLLKDNVDNINGQLLSVHGRLGNVESSIQAIEITATATPTEAKLP